MISVLVIKSSQLLVYFDTYIDFIDIMDNFIVKHEIF